MITNNDSFFTFSFVEQGIFSNKCRDDLRTDKIGTFAPIQNEQRVPNAKTPILKAALLCKYREKGQNYLGSIGTELEKSWRHP